MRKSLAALVSLLLVLGLATTAFANGNDGDNDNDGQNCDGQFTQPSTDNEDHLGEDCGGDVNTDDDATTTTVNDDNEDDDDDDEVTTTTTGDDEVTVTVTTTTAQEIPPAADESTTTTVIPFDELPPAMTVEVTAPTGINDEGSQELPFTGFNFGLVIAAAMGSLAAGILLRRGKSVSDADYL